VGGLRKGVVWGGGVEVTEYEKRLTRISSGRARSCGRGPLVDNARISPSERRRCSQSSIIPRESSSPHPSRSAVGQR